MDNTKLCEICGNKNNRSFGRTCSNDSCIDRFLKKIYNVYDYTIDSSPPPFKKIKK